MKQNERVMVAIAVVIALVAVAGFAIYRSSSGTPPTDTVAPSGDQTAGPGGMGGGGTGTKSTGKPTLVPKGITLGQYLNKVYGLVKGKKYKEAFEFQPPTVKTNGYDSFASSRQQMPVTSYKIGPVVEKDKTASVAVTQVLGGQAGGGTWVTTWVFEKTGTQWAAVKTEVGMK